MTTTTTEQPARGSSIDGSTESLTGITRLGESLSTIHEESAAGLEEAAKLTQEAADERKRAAQAALVLNDADGRKLGKDLLGRINAYQELIGQATLLEDEVSNLRAQAKVETEAAAAATAFAEESTKFRNEMADVRSTERFGEFEQAE